MSETFTLYKLIILYMLNKVDFPLTTSQISEFVLDKGYTTYFKLQEAISELTQSELIRTETTHNRTLYHLTESGAETIHYFSNKISSAIRKDIDDFLTEKQYDLKEVYISDINTELVNAYCIIRDDINELIAMLRVMQDEFLPINVDERKVYYTAKRERFNYLKVNCDKSVNTEKAALMIFLNKTCFNGLFRVNRKGLFNVPMGAYKNPMICDEVNLRAVSNKLQKVNIVCGDYRLSKEFIDKNTFVYFDPPYRPLTNTANFTAYTENLFNDKCQKELANYVSELDEKGAKIVVSNSDPKNSNEDDNFFDDIYSDYKIKRVEATRMISCNGSSRGKIKELLISNF